MCSLANSTEANLSVLRSGKAKGVRFHTINRICYFLQCDILKFCGNLAKMKIRKSKYHQKSVKVVHCGFYLEKIFHKLDAKRFLKRTGNQSSVKKFVFQIMTHILQKRFLKRTEEQSSIKKLFELSVIFSHSGCTL